MREVHHDTLNTIRNSLVHFLFINCVRKGS